MQLLLQIANGAVVTAETESVFRSEEILNLVGWSETHIIVSFHRSAPMNARTTYNHSWRQEVMQATPSSGLWRLTVIVISDGPDGWAEATAAPGAIKCGFA